MNILLLSRYSRLGASSRLRSMQYLPVLAREGLNVQVAPFFDDAYLRALYSGQGARGSTLAYMRQRLRQMRQGPRPDVIWLEYEALPWIPWLIEGAVLPRGVPIVSDYDDAVFHRYDTHRHGVVRALLGRKIGRVMAASAVVVAGNEYLADHARRAGANRVETVPTVVDLDAYDVDATQKSGDTARIGWIGTPQTWKELAHSIHGILDPLLAQKRAMFRAVGAGMQAETSGTLEILPWTEATEVALIQSMDIGVMPLPDTPWTKGKCGYKLIQYMACGLPVVASPVGVNRDIVEHGVNGFLAETDEDWRTAIATLLNDADLRQRMGAAGRRKVEDHYSLQVWGPRVAQMLRSVAERQGVL
ncbi:glycosyltransferase family 4 protein [Yoonia sp.]|uniref:glycosyltransferase family 4 protein n=1 Tax=Yoonia sp. TaxID=2212373 RepID=UPI00391D2EEC